MSPNLRDMATSLGMWCQSADPLVLDSAASVKPDWICFDTQHGASISSLTNANFTGVASYEVNTLVRVAAIDNAAIGRALDLGADGIIVPLVETADQAEAAVAATRHAPNGTRSYGMQTNRVGPFDERPFVAIQVETAAAVDNLTEISLVDGVDALYVGPADLGLAIVGQPTPGIAGFENETVAAALERVVTIAEGAGVIPGYHCSNGEDARLAAEKGFRMMAVASDVGSVASNLAHQLKQARSPSS